MQNDWDHSEGIFDNNWYQTYSTTLFVQPITDLITPAQVKSLKHQIS